MRKLFNNKAYKEVRQALRNDMPTAELLLWEHLSGRQTGHKFRRQYSIAEYVVDFYCPSAKLAIEVDGDGHYERGANIKDERRQHFIESKGIRVIRFTNTDVYESPDEVMEIIQSYLPPLPTSPRKGEEF